MYHYDTAGVGFAQGGRFFGGAIEDILWRVGAFRDQDGRGTLSPSVLLVIGDDEERLHLRRALSGEGWHVLPVGSGAQARQVAAKQDFEIAVVDNRLPDERGFQVISAVQKPNVSTVALLRDEDTMDRIVGIELGADYYMRSPVNPRELVARVKQILRKRSSAGEASGSPGRIYVGDLEIDPDQVRVRKGEREIVLSPREFRLLYTLAQSPGRVFPRGTLLRQVWGEDEFIDERTVNVYVQRLRAKLGDNSSKPELIETVRGFGYRLVKPPA
jgi:DNA-binding response OmpR family regulator